MPLPNIFNEDLDSQLSKTIAEAASNDAEMLDLKQSIIRLKSECPKIQHIIDRKTGVTLNEEECKLLSEYFALDNKLIALENRVCYLRGFTDGTATKELFE